MKKFIFSLFIGFVGLFSFCSSQFLEGINCGNSSDNPCYLDQIDSFSCEGPSVGWSLGIIVHGERPGGAWNCRRGSYGGSKVTCSDLNSVKLAVEDCGRDFSQAKYFYYTVDSPYSISDFKMSGLVSSDKMPVSALTPAVTGIKDTVFQLIPLIIFISIGLLLCSICFVSIRWLVNWLSVKIKSVFSSKR